MQRGDKNKGTAQILKFSVTVGLSHSKKICIICFIERPLKMMKNAFFGHAGKTA